MYCESTEIEHIEMKLVDGMPIDYWRGVEDGIDLAMDIACRFARNDADKSAELLRVLQLSLSELRDRRIFWLMRTIPSEICVEDESATTRIGPD